MATSAVETAKQENGSRVFFESVIENNCPCEPCISNIVDIQQFWTMICLMIKMVDGQFVRWPKQFDGAPRWPQ